MNDVRVLGLNFHGVYIEDISVSVPHQVTVAISGSKAAVSKDLWRLIGQKQLFRLDPGAHRDFPHVPPAPSEGDRLREETRALAEQNRLLQQTIDQQGSRLDQQGRKLDAILGLLESGRLVAAAPGTASSVGTTTPKAEIVDNGVPTYIPSNIKPQNVESHVEVKSETSEGSGVTGAGEALRRLRNKGGR
jgi:hypothetical protein